MCEQIKKIIQFEIHFVIFSVFLLAVAGQQQNMSFVFIEVDLKRHKTISCHMMKIVT